MSIRLKTAVIVTFLLIQTKDEEDELWMRPGRIEASPRIPAARTFAATEPSFPSPFAPPSHDFGSSRMLQRPPEIRFDDWDFWAESFCLHRCCLSLRL